MSTTRQICSIIVFAGLLISVPAAMASYPWGDWKEWSPSGGDCSWSNPGNWSPPGVPTSNDDVAVLPNQPGPCITGNAQCSMLSLNPWDPTSWGARDTVVTITETALDVNFGAALQINSQVDYDSKLGGETLVSRAIVNIYGGTVTTPNWLNSPPTLLYGITIGGGSSTYGNSYGILNIYGGLVSVPRIAIYYGDVNLYGGTLECPPALISPLECIVLRQDRPENRINVNGGTLKLKGNHVTELNDYITNGRIVCIRGGVLGVPVYDGTWTTLTGTNNFNVAWGPQPDNNATNVHYKTPDGNSITLGWQPGDLAKQHDVYFGTSFADVNFATTASAAYKGSRYDANSDPHNWTITDFNFKVNTNYYWRIDETNDSNVIAKGLVWKFTTHDGYAYNPMPVNAQVGLNEPLVLSWTPGDWAASTNGHRVYFGTTQAAVSSKLGTTSAPTYRGTQTGTTYSLSNLAGSFTLIPGNTYYWAVEEVNGTKSWNNGDDATVVWSFTPAGYINIDDFEDYNSTDELTANWPNLYPVTGCGDPTIIGNAGRVLIRDSTGKYMRYSYYHDSAGMAFSEAKRPYIGGTSFTGGGVISPAPKALRIDYRGYATNAADPIYDRMYVAIEDTAHNVSVYENPDAHAAQVGNWTSWYTALKDINAVGNTNLNAITGFAIGFGTRCDNFTFGGGDGNVMFDNIRLYAPTCVPQFGPKADLDGDCDVDINDLDIFVNDWLLKAEPIPFPVMPPSKAPILWYKFNEAGQIANPVDSGTGDPNLYTGTVTNFIAQNWDIVGGRDGNGCLYLPPGAGCYVNVPVASLSFMGDANHTTPGGGGISFAVWINADTTAGNMRSFWNALFSVWNGAVNIETLVVHCPSPFPPTDPTGPGALFIKTSPSATASAFNMRESDYGGRWNHWAFTKSDYSMKVYCNGSLMGHCDANGQPGDPNANVYGPLFDPNVGAFRIGTSGGNWGMWNGRIDDFQVYDYCLSAEEIAYLASDGGFFPVIPLISPANFNTDGGLPTDANQIVNFADFAILGQEWRTIVLWP